MILELLRDVDRKYGLCQGLQIERYEGFGDECGTTGPDGQPNGKAWVRCPHAPNGSVWKQPYHLLKAEDFKILELR